jgi:hypothetical protein
MAARTAKVNGITSASQVTVAFIDERTKRNVTEITTPAFLRILKASDRESKETTLFDT